MPQSPPRACKRCGVAGCTKHKPNKVWHSSTKETRKQYGSAQWKRTRSAVLARDGHLCQVCIAQGILSPAKIVDHITPQHKQQFSFYDMNNLQAICKPCHDTKTAEEARESRGLQAKPDFIV
tara:strand:+ start:1154 stop:1519 length:366 start_codon:yes stop_codon:yes gene_type:complete